MTPAAWRKKAKLSLRALAKRLACTRMTVSRYESGEREAPNSVAIAYEKLSGGSVTSEDLNRARRKYLARQRADEEQERTPEAAAV